MSASNKRLTGVWLSIILLTPVGSPANPLPDKQDDETHCSVLLQDLILRGERKKQFHILEGHLNCTDVSIERNGDGSPRDQSSVRTHRDVRFQWIRKTDNYKNAIEGKVYFYEKGGAQVRKPWRNGNYTEMFPVELSCFEDTVDDQLVTLHLSIHDKYDQWPCRNKKYGEKEYATGVNYSYTGKLGVELLGNDNYQLSSINKKDSLKNTTKMISQSTDFEEYGEEYGVRRLAVRSHYSFIRMFTGQYELWRLRSPFSEVQW